jgi:hypothetical protein
MEEYQKRGYFDMSQIDGRKEILGVSLQTKTGTRLRAYEILRDDKGGIRGFSVVISEDKDEGTMTGGRMVDWIKDHNRKAN